MPEGSQDNTRCTNDHEYKINQTDQRPRPLEADTPERHGTEANDAATEPADPAHGDHTASSTSAVVPGTLLSEQPVAPAPPGPETHTAAGAAHNSGDRTATSSNVAVPSTAPPLPACQVQCDSQVQRRGRHCTEYGTQIRRSFLAAQQDTQAARSIEQRRHIARDACLAGLQRSTVPPDQQSPRTTSRLTVCQRCSVSQCQRRVRHCQVPGVLSSASQVSVSALERRYRCRLAHALPWDEDPADSCTCDSSPLRPPASRPFGLT